MGIKTAGEGGDHRRAGKDLHLEEAGIDTENLRRHFRIVNGPQGPADPGTPEVEGEEHHQQGCAPDQVIVLQITVKGERPDREIGDPGETGRAAGEIDIFVDDDIDDDPETEGRHRQIMPLELEDREADDKGEGPDRQSGEEHRQPGINTVRRGQDRREIGTEAIKGRLAE